MTKQHVKNLDINNHKKLSPRLVSRGGYEKPSLREGFYRGIC